MRLLFALVVGAVVAAAGCGGQPVEQSPPPSPAAPANPTLRPLPTGATGPAAPTDPGAFTPGVQYSGAIAFERSLP